MYYLKLYYKLLEWEWYTNPNVMRLFIHCLLKANRYEKKWQGITIKAGSFVTSYENLAFETGLTVRQVRTAIEKLKTTNELTHKGHSQYSIITVNNWNLYQANDKQNDKQMTNERQTNDKQMTTTRECKNVKNDRVSINSETKFDPFITNPLIRFFKDEYFRIFNNKPYLTAIERNKLCELSSDIEDFKETIPVVLSKMKDIDFGFENWKPTASWLLKDSNYTAVLNGSYDRQKKETIFDRWRKEELNNDTA